MQTTCKKPTPHQSSAVARFLAILLTLASPLAAQPLKVAALHPLFTDLLQQLGGKRVEVIDLVGDDSDLHHFEPTAADLRKAQGARLFFTPGMGLEADLSALRDIVGDRLVEVGTPLPARSGGCSGCDHNHGDHDHAEHSIDPHWWHSIDLYRRAAGIVAEKLAEADPPNAATYKTNASTYRERLNELERWTRRQVARIPRDRRHLATSHDAFGYLCRDFGFTSHPIQGLNREQIPDATTLANLIKRLKSEQVAALFPENRSNPKILAALTRDTGIRLGPPLDVDGSTSGSFEAMVRHNITAIVETLR